MDSNGDRFPNKLKMSGLPIFLMGWNSVFQRTDQIRDNCPVYVLEQYLMYHFVYVPLAKIYRKNKRWVLECPSCNGDCENCGPGISKLYGEKYKGKLKVDPLPMGTWSHGATLTIKEEEKKKV